VGKIAGHFEYKMMSVGQARFSPMDRTVGLQINFFFSPPLCFSLFRHAPLFFRHFFPPASISTLKQHNTTGMPSDRLCGFRVKNAHRKKNQWRKKGGRKKRGVWRKSEKNSGEKVKNSGEKKYIMAYCWGASKGIT
jgi:hypothetical protein